MPHPICVFERARDFNLFLLDDDAVAGIVFHFGEIAHDFRRAVVVESPLYEKIVFAFRQPDESATAIGICANGVNFRK